MTRIPGNIIPSHIEVGAKWQAKDGRIFDFRYDCEQYEKKLEKAEKLKKLQKASDFITETIIPLNTGDVDSTFYIKRFETKEQYEETISALNCNLEGVSYFTTGKLSDSEFPKTFIIEKTYISYVDSMDEKKYHFTEVDKFIGSLQEDINLIKANYY